MCIGSDIFSPEAGDFRKSEEFIKFKNFVIIRMKKGFMSSREVKDRIPPNSPHMLTIRWLGDVLDVLHTENKLEIRPGIITKYKRLVF